MTTSTGFVVIFGSAAAFVLGTSTRQPRDIDVAYGGGIDRDSAEALALEWAAGVGLTRLSGDAHKAYLSTRDGSQWSVVTLPVPAGLAGSAIVLRGDVEVAWRPVTTTSAIIRALHADPVACGSALAEHWATAMRLAFVEFQIVPGSCSGDLHPDDGYTGEGVDSLRRALGHCAPGEWDSILTTLAETLPTIAAFLGRIAQEDLPTDVQDAIVGGTGSGAAVHRFGCIRFGYADGTAGASYRGPRWPLADIGTAPWATC